MELLADAASASTSPSARCTSSACRACRAASTPTTPATASRSGTRSPPSAPSPLASSVAAVLLQHLLQQGQGQALPPPGPDPWDARTIEWMIPSARRRRTTSTRSRPSPALDDFWYRKYGEDDGRTAGAHRRAPRTSPSTATARACTCRRRPTGRSSRPSVCRSSPTACIYTCGCASSAASSWSRGIYGWAIEPPDDPGLRPRRRSRSRRRRRGDRYGRRCRGGEPTPMPASRPRRSRPLADTVTLTLGEQRPTAGRRDRPPVEHDTNTGISNTKLAMWLFLGSECLLFGGLITTYLLYKHAARRGRRPSEVYDIPFTSVSSFVLLMSSLTMVLAVVGHRARRPPPPADLARRHRRCSAPPSSPARSTSSPSSTARAWATPPAASARPSTR